MPSIPCFEENPSFLARVIGLRKEMLARGDILVTSAMTVGEILVKPALENDRKAGEKYRSFFRSLFRRSHPVRIERR
ncbi:MAG: hypothetical protein SFV51_06570 [Bryobacteraceae bacterium]|nr:hypothetical protein [Bryobacteraceae bacterium]